MNSLTRLTLSLIIIPFIIILVAALPYTLVPYDFNQKPHFDANQLKAGDIVLLHARKWSPQKFIGYFNHAMICYDRDGVVYTTEATPDKHIDILTGKPSQISSRLPLDSIKGYDGQYCVRRLKRPLTKLEKERLNNAIDARKGAQYDSLLFLSYWMSLTRWQ